MLHFCQIIVVLVFATGGTKAQGGGTTAAGDSYVCVPAGNCGNGGTPTSPGIDPRIVTPGDPCPSGQVPCYTQGPASNCGVRYANPILTADGPVTDNAYPWQAFIRNSSNPVYAGSGVLIDNYHILTAAHKVYGDRNNPSAVTVLMGVTNSPTAATVQTRTATGITIHPSYVDDGTYKNDIAIITVNPAFNLSGPSINSLCLPAANNAAESAGSYLGQACVVAGWGETSFQQGDAPTNPMKQVNLSPIAIATCRTGLATVLPTNVDTYLDQTGGEVCAGGQKDQDACTYDGGAPLTCPSTGKGTMVGLVIWGKGCGQANVYGVYVSVPYYRGWIDTTITALNNG